MSPVKEFTARHRFAHITARKARYVADLIRGRGVNEALELLQFTPNRGATFYSKVVKSAVANASMDEAINVNRLFVCEARADVEAQEDTRSLVVNRLDFIRFMTRSHHVALQMERIGSRRLGRPIFPLERCADER